MDVIERIIRSLIKEGRLSRARALLSIFYEDYPYLSLELEIASGNYKAALNIYNKLSEEKKKEYRSTMEDIKKVVESRGYSEDFKDAVAEYTKGNYQGAVALLEGITKDYPELVEAIALKYEIYLKRGDITKAREIEEILKRFDVSHPALIEHMSQKEKGWNIASWMVAAATILLVFMVVFIFPKLANLRSEIISEIKSEMARKFDIQLTTYLNRLEMTKEELGKKIEENAKELVNLSDRLNAIENSQKDLIAFFRQGYNELQSKSVKTETPDIDKVLEKLDKMERILITLQSSITNIYSHVYASRAVSTSALKSILVPGEIVYKPSSELDKAKIYWLAGYIMYLKNQYDDAIDLFNKALKIVDVLFPHVYFHDDCVYYLGLSYYMNMNYKMARKYFEMLKEEFPESQYVDDAEFFMKSIPGGE